MYEMVSTVQAGFLRMRVKSIPESHQERVRWLQDSIHHSKGPLAMARSAGCSLRPLEYKKGVHLIETGQMDNILEVNTSEQYADLEPMVTMESLVAACLERDVIPSLVTEFRHMTYGGAFQGLAGESSSHRVGLLDETVREVDFITGNGNLVETSVEKHEEMLSGLSGAYGSLGLVTRLRIRVEPADKFVQITYRRFRHFQEVLDLFENELAEKVSHYVEAVALSEDDFMVIQAQRVPRPSPINRLFKTTYLRHSWSPWFFYHAAGKKHLATEYMPLEDYLFRWDRGAFWASLLQLRHTFLNRLMFGSKLDAASCYRRLKRRGSEEQVSKRFLQDMMVPHTAAAGFFSWIAGNVRVFPIWLIPIRRPNQSRLFSIPQTGGPGYIDFGVWGDMDLPIPEAISLNRAAESELARVQGRKCLWSHNFYTEDEFWKIYDHAEYERLRRQAEAIGRFTGIYEKTNEYYRSVAGRSAGLK